MRWTIGHKGQMVQSFGPFEGTVLGEFMTERCAKEEANYLRCETFLKEQVTPGEWTVSLGPEGLEPLKALTSSRIRGQKRDIERIIDAYPFACYMALRAVPKWYKDRRYLVTGNLQVAANMEPPVEPDLIIFREDTLSKAKERVKKLKALSKLIRFISCKEDQSIISTHIFTISSKMKIVRTDPGDRHNLLLWMRRSETAEKIIEYYSEELKVLYA